MNAPEAPARLLYAPALPSDIEYVVRDLMEAERLELYERHGGMPSVNELVCWLLNTPSPFVVLADDRPLSVVTFTIARPGVVTIFGYSHSDWPKYVRTMSRGVRALQTLIEARVSVHRMEMTSPLWRKSAHRWYRAFGFKHEGVLRGYGAGGEDFVLMAYVNRSED